MRTLVAVALMIGLVLVGCSSSPSTEVELPPAVQSQSGEAYSLEDVQRVTFETSSFDGSTYFEADLTARMLTYAELEGSGYGPKEECGLSDDQVQSLLNILDEGKVWEWESDYPDNRDYVDGMTWSLVIATSEITQKSRGENQDPAPETFRDLVEGFREFKNECAEP